MVSYCTCLETNEVIQQLNLSQVSKIIGALKVGGIVNSIPCQSQRLEPIVDVREMVYVEEGRRLSPQINALTLGSLQEVRVDLHLQTREIWLMGGAYHQICI